MSNPARNLQRFSLLLLAGFLQSHWKSGTVPRMSKHRALPKAVTYPMKRTGWKSSAPMTAIKHA
eukprot:6151102-Ditylum_brightwellii.AAC.1